MAAERAGPPWPRSPRRAQRNPRRLRRGRQRAGWQQPCGQPGREEKLQRARSASRTRGQRGRAGRARVGLPPTTATRAVPASCPHRPAAHPRVDAAGRGQDGCERREDVAFSRVPAQRGIALSPARQETAGVGRENSRSGGEHPAVRGALGRSSRPRRSAASGAAVERCRSRSHCNCCTSRLHRALMSATAGPPNRTYPAWCARIASCAPSYSCTPSWHLRVARSGASESFRATRMHGGVSVRAGRD